MGGVPGCTREWVVHSSLPGEVQLHDPGHHCHVPGRVHPYVQLHLTDVEDLLGEVQNEVPTTEHVSGGAQGT